MISKTITSCTKPTKTKAAPKVQKKNKTHKQLVNETPKSRNLGASQHCSITASNNLQFQSKPNGSQSFRPGTSYRRQTTSVNNLLLSTFSSALSLLQSQGAKRTASCLPATSQGFAAGRERAQSCLLFPPANVNYECKATRTNHQTPCLCQCLCVSSMTQFAGRHSN